MENVLTYHYYAEDVSHCEGKEGRYHQVIVETESADCHEAADIEPKDCGCGNETVSRPKDNLLSVLDPRFEGT